ncbi:lytic polysaccharide monooxygenase [Pseudomonas gingeri]|uniref:lytic polysaccharide monooxygenase n=1 Tax=Pseudomonas gingeri TaxID=117681 RepID=UPI0015BE7915|nr:lytic polysaccharide monooxygenase [Pseudomonas gingeri]NWD50495.1 lytic polysaccharide monooxygenase [Pseudomonas gingeri]
MNSLHFYARPLIGCALATLLAVPALSWGHGAFDIPITRQTLCRSYADYWGAPDKMKDAGCRRAVTEPGYSGQLTHAATQWHEVTLNIGGRYNDADGGEAAVKALVPDGKLCSVNRPGMNVLNLAMPQWTKTEVKPDSSGKVTMRLIATAPHVPSFVRIYLSKPGYDSATRPLKWDDLELIHSEELTASRKDWGDKPPVISGASGFFQFNVQIPASRSGTAVLFTRWQRRDPVGEGFYGCSDIAFDDKTQPSPWVKEKVFIDGNGIDPKAGDTVHFRVFGHDRAVSELIDLKLPIDASNQNPATWGAQLANLLSSSPHIIRVGVKKNETITFNPTDIYANYNYLMDAGDSTQMSVDTEDDGGGNPGPVDERPPVAVIEGRTEIKAGERFTLDGKKSVSYNSTPLRYVWTFLGGEGWTYGSNTEQTFTITTPASDKASTAKLLLNVYDDANKKRHEAEGTLTATPASGGGDAPAYQEGTDYKAGDVVSNAGGQYRCKPWPATGWCKGAAWAYAPGTGVHWQEAWDKL